MKTSLFSTFPRKSTHDQTKINPWNIRKLYVVAVWKGLNFAVVKNKYLIKKTNPLHSFSFQLHFLKYIWRQCQSSKNHPYFSAVCECTCEDWPSYDKGNTMHMEVMHWGLNEYEITMKCICLSNVPDYTYRA